MKFRKNNLLVVKNKQRLFHKLRTTQQRVLFILLCGSAVILIYFAPRSVYVCNSQFFIDKFCNYVKTNYTQCYSNVSTFLGEKSDLINENKKFRNVILRYEKQFLDYYKIQQENEYLRSILPLVSEQNIDTVSVVPCFSPPSAYLTLFFRSSSVANRINLGNIVFSTQGVVGQVVDIKRISNEEIEVIVMLITNIQSRIPVVSAKSHKHAILCGQNSKFFAVKYVKSIENDNDVAFIEEAKDFIDGEILEFSEGDMKIPVAKIVMQKDDTLAKWVVDSPTHYVTVAVNCKFNF